MSDEATIRWLTEETRRIHGWFAEGEGALLYRTLRYDAPTPIAVELGVWLGRSTAWLAAAVRDRPDWQSGRAYAVDHWCGNADSAAHREFLADRSPDWLRRRFKENMARLLLKRYVAAVTGDSLTVARNWNRGQIGLLHVDASHDYASVRADVDAWLPHVAPNGYVALHDQDLDGPSRVVRELTAAGQLERGVAVDGTWMGRKLA